VRELTERKKLEILMLFVGGYSYDDISAKAEVSKGSVVNVVTELRTGHFPEFGNIVELVDVLRDLAVQLRSKGIGVSEAALGLAFFSRLDGMGVTPDKLWNWVEMCREMSPAEAPVQEFIAAALELFKFGQETGESYDSTVAKWSELRARSESLTEKVEGLTSEKKELETARTTLTEECQKLRQDKESLKNEVADLSAEREALSKETSLVEATNESLKVEAEELERKVSVLKPEVEALERLGFGKGELKKLRENLEEMASSRGLTPEDLKAGFFRSLDEYGGILGVGKKRERLEVEVANLQAQRESLDKATSRLESPLEEVEEALKSLISLKRKGITPSMVVSYFKVVSGAGLEPHELEKELLELGGLRKAVTFTEEKLATLKQEEHKHAAAVDVLLAEEERTKTTIRELKESAIKEVNQASLTIVEEVRRVHQIFLEDIKRWGDIKAEIGKYEQELKLARYFARLPLSKEALAVLVEELPAMVIVQYLTIALVWCTKKCNPKLKPPRTITSKYYHITEFTSVELTDLLSWSLTALNEGGAHGNR